MAAPAERDVALSTYQHLRMVLVALPALMLASAAATFIGGGAIEPSISGYYDGVLRDVFVGMLVGAAACLVAYKGAPVEDYALNMAGFYALFVAFVPRPGYLASLAPAKYDKAIRGITIVAICVVVVTAVFLIAEWRSGHWAGDALTSGGWKTRAFYRISQGMGIGFLILLVYQSFFVSPPTFDWVHGVAAVFLIISLTVTVATHGWPAAAGEQELPVPHVGWYRGLVGVMTLGAGLAFLVALALNPDYKVLALEAWEVFFFFVFWAREMILKRNPLPGELSVATGNAGRSTVE